MQFRWAKYKTRLIGRGHAPILAFADELDRHNVEPMNAFKCLGVVPSPELKHREKVDAAVKKREMLPP